MRSASSSATTLFWKGIARLSERHARGVVETRDLLRAMEEVSGRSLGKFFEQAVYKPGHPECDVQVSWEKKVLTVTVKQHQATTDGVPAASSSRWSSRSHDEAGGKGAPRRERLLVTQKTDTFAVPCETRPAFVVVDPEMRILGEVHLKGAQRHAARAAREGADGARPVARGRGARDERRPDDDRRARGAARRRATRCGWCATSAPRRSGASGRRRRSRRSRSAATVKHPKVRRAVAEALGRFRTQEAEDAIRPRAL